jgi:hypothetical protein
MEPLRLPEIAIPFPFQESPATAALKEHAIDWVQRFHLIQSERTLKRFLAGKFWLLVSYCFPRGRPEALQVVVEWDCWAFMLDDQSDVGDLRHQPAKLRRLLDDLLLVLDGSLPQSGPLFASLQDVWEHMQQWATPAWRERFRRSVSETFASLVWEAENRARGVTPDPESYVAWRHASSGFATHMDLADFTEGIELPPETQEHPLIVQLTEAANKVISWTNDLYSLDKEIRQQDKHNLVLVLEHAAHVPRQEAIDRVVHMIDGEVARFLALEERLSEVSNPIAPALQRYVGVLRSWMRGNLDWSRATGRYDPSAGQQGAARSSDLDPIVDESLDRPPAASHRVGYARASAFQRNALLLAAILGGSALALLWLVRRRKVRLVRPHPQPLSIFDGEGSQRRPLQSLS